jgi:hypothetical protein
MRNSNSGPDHRQDWVQDETLLNIFGEVVWIFYCKKVEWGEYKRTQQVQSHPRRGGIAEINAQDNPRIRLWFICKKLGCMQRFV